MRISPVNNQTNFKAIVPKYYEWAKKDFERGIGVSSEVLTQLHFEVAWGDIKPQDGIDTVEAIKKLIGGSGEFIEQVVQNFKNLLKD